jgi:hypothetical protein
MDSNYLKLGIAVFAVVALIVTVANFSYNAAHTSFNNDVLLGSMIVSNPPPVSISMRINNPTSKSLHAYLTIEPSAMASVNTSTLVPPGEYFLIFTITSHSNSSSSFNVRAWGKI